MSYKSFNIHKINVFVTIFKYIRIFIDNFISQKHDNFINHYLIVLNIH
jgi:hypothetical protein